MGESKDREELYAPVTFRVAQEWTPEMQAEFIKAAGRMGASWALGATLRQIRIAKGWTIQKLSEVVRKSVPHLSDLERGRKGTRNVTDIAQALGVPLSRLPGVCRHCGSVLTPTTARTPGEGR